MPTSFSSARPHRLGLIAQAQDRFCPVAAHSHPFNWIKVLFILSLLFVTTGACLADPRVYPPTISPNGGSFAGPVTVTISGSDPTYYTLDGSSPDSSQSDFLYTGPITISTTTTVRAYSASNDPYNPYLLDSSVVSATFTITGSPTPVLTGITITPANVTGGTSATGTLTLDSPAPTSGTTISLASDNAAASVPASVSVTAGATTVAFPVTTNGVATSTTANITATFGGMSQSAALTINPASSIVNDLSVYSTGSGKVTLYWTALSSALGYNIYRGSSAGGEDYAHPVNGATPVNAASYSGSAMDMDTDAGLVNGTEYFYTIKAVYNSGESQASNEDSDIPDPVDVPWDTRNPGAILSAIRSDFASDTNDIGADPFSLRAVGPDGTIYDDNFSAAQPPDGTIDPASSQLLRPDGSTQTLPNDDGELYIAPSSGASAQSSAAGTPAKRPNGPIRRVKTFANYRGADGYFALPITNTNSQAAIANKDAATIYLGVVGQKLAVDAGVTYSDTTGWGLEMLITGHLHGIVAQPDPNSNKAIIPEVKLVNAPNEFIRFSSGSTVRITYWGWSNMKRISRQKLSLLVVDDVDSGFAGALAGPASALGKQESVAAKRVHSIAQNRLGVTATGSQMDNCAWDQGQVILSGTSNMSQVWNAPITAEDLKYNGGNSSVTATELSPYTAEINIDINPPPH